MKKYFLLFALIFTVGLSSCRKVVDTTAYEFNAAAQAAEDDATIKSYLFTNNITNTTKDASGLYYVINNPGTGAHPTVNSSITVAYKLRLTDETEVESKNSINFPKLADLFKAWQIALPLIGKGGSITLYVPSGLGNGNQEASSIPANSVLIFDITLQGFVN